MTNTFDPAALVQAAKSRHYAYKPISQGGNILGQDYVPSVLQGRSITQNPAAAAALAAQGVKGANSPSVAGRPSSPLNPVEPTANGQTLPGFADGGEVISKVSKFIQSLLDRFGSKALPSDVSDAEHLDLLKKVQNKTITPEENDRLIGSLSRAPTEAQILGNSVHPMTSPSVPDAQLRLRRTASQNDPISGVDPYNTVDAVNSRNANDELLNDALNQGHAEGGSVDDSSLKWIADMARKLGASSTAEDRARVATGIAKQFYGLDENGTPVFGGKAWLSSQHGTPPRILDELTSIPGGLARLTNILSGTPKPSANTTPQERDWMSRKLTPPDWSDEAGQRVEDLDKAVQKTTGVGEPHGFIEHAEDMAGALATPFPASKVAGEAPVLQRIFEYMAPVRPSTVDRYVTDSAALGGFSTALDKIAEHLSQKSPQTVDPEFEDAAITSTNAGYAGGGKILDLTEKLAQLAKRVRTVAPDEVSSTVASLPEAKAQKELQDFSTDFRNRVQQRAADQQNLIATLGHKYQVGDTIAGEKGNYKILGLAATKYSPEDVDRIKQGLPSRTKQEKANSPWLPAYHVESPEGDRFTMGEWGVKHSFEGPREVPGPLTTSDRINALRHNIFGATDEPNWVAADKMLTSIPGHEDVIPHYDAMKHAFNVEVLPGTESDHVERVLQPLADRFDQSLRDLEQKWGYPSMDPETGFRRDPTTPENPKDE